MRKHFAFGALVIASLISVGCSDSSNSEANPVTTDESKVSSAPVDTEAQVTEAPTTKAPKTTTTTTTTTLPPLPVLSRDYCTNTPPDGIFTKDGNATKGQCLHFWANIFQFDANTGPHQFLGRYGDTSHYRNYQYSDATVSIECIDAMDEDTWRSFTLTQGFEAYAIPPQNTCALLAPIAQDDMVEIWAVNWGTASYSTTMGGTNSYTQFVLVDIAKS
jgi:hypothetical protein